MGSMAQDAIEMGLDGYIAPDGLEWCDSIYERPAVNIEIWGDDDCTFKKPGKISLDHLSKNSTNFVENESDNPVLEITDAIMIVESIKDGVNPFTGASLPSNDISTNPQVVSSLSAILRHEKEAVLGKAYNPIDRKKQQRNIDNGHPKNYGLTWTDIDINYIIESFKKGKNISDIAKDVQRTATGIINLLIKKELITEEESISLNPN